MTTRSSSPSLFTSTHAAATDHNGPYSASGLFSPALVVTSVNVPFPLLWYSVLRYPPATGCDFCNRPFPFFGVQFFAIPPRHKNIFVAIVVVVPDRNAGVVARSG